MSSSTDRGLSQEEFPVAEELDLPLKQEMSRDLITYNVDKEVMEMARVRLTHAKEVKVVDMSKATKMKVGLN